MTESKRTPLIIGAGPAGLTAALRLAERGVTPRVYEATGCVGGLARTPRNGDWRVDPGGHRFFTKSEEVLDLWNSLLPVDQWISVPRRSAMLVNGEYVRYPLVGRDLLTQLGFGRGLYGLGSLTWFRMRRGIGFVDQSASFREWGTHEFGRYWYNLFFDGYVRKTWQANPDDIASDWANQRIKPITWRRRRPLDGADQDVFRYPRLGPGQLWEAAAAALADVGAAPSLDVRVVGAHFDGRDWTVKLHNGDTASGDALFSSMPLQSLVECLQPKPPRSIRAAAATLKHRGLITVAVAIRKHLDIPYHWVYTPGKAFQAGRIQNYGLWSSGLTPDGWDGTFLGFEYFVGPNAELLAADDERLRAVVEDDLRALGVDDTDVEHVMIVRSRFAYPIYDPVRDRSVGRIRDFLRRNYPSLHPIGRNGMHRYDNQDHAMLSAMHSVDRYFGGNVDPWQVNTDRGYHEAGLRKD
ncbi:MAG: FAD-dependent oxidoreductase [Mycobacterium sp.]